MKTKMVLTLLGRDSWSRPVYQDENGKLWKDVDPRPYCKPELCNSTGNEFDGEPDTPMRVMEKYKDVVVEYKPHRDTW